MIKIYTDGACSGNPGPGGWGYVIIKDGDVTSSFGVGGVESVPSFTVLP